MFRSKKALSPLIAAVLLIVVVVGVGALVTGIVRNFVTENKATIDSKSDEISCSRDIIIEVVEIGDDPQICKGSDYITATLENKGSADIDDFQLVVMATTGFYRNESISASDVFTTGEAQEFNGTFSGITASDIQQVKLVPKLKKKGKSGYHFCSDVAIKYEGLDDC